MAKHISEEQARLLFQLEAQVEDALIEYGEAQARETEIFLLLRDHEMPNEDTYRQAKVETESAMVAYQRAKLARAELISGLAASGYTV